MEISRWSSTSMVKYSFKSHLFLSNWIWIFFKVISMTIWISSMAMEQLLSMAVERLLWVNSGILAMVKKSVFSVRLFWLNAYFRWAKLMDVDWNDKPIWAFSLLMEPVIRSFNQILESCYVSILPKQRFAIRKYKPL